MEGGVIDPFEQKHRESPVICLESDEENKLEAPPQALQDGETVLPFPKCLAPLHNFPGPPSHPAPVIPSEAAPKARKLSSPVVSK